MKKVPTNGITPKLVVIMPCKNEADNLEVVITKLNTLKPVAIIVGLDPTTTDNTSGVASRLGCDAVSSEYSGYDPAVHEATVLALKKFPNSLLLYTDAGDKYGYGQVPKMISMINNGSDMVLGVRIDKANTMLWHQKLGTKFILILINLLTIQNIQDVSPFRLVKSSVFDDVKMQPKKFRWPSELLVKSLACGLIVSQVDITALPRKGTSKVSGSIINSLRAGFEMLSSLQFINYKKELKHETENR